MQSKSIFKQTFCKIWQSYSKAYKEMRTASKHVYYLGWNRSPAQVGCMRQVLGPGALGRPRGIGYRGRWEGGSGWGIHVYPWLIHDNVWQKPLQCCKVISLQLIKINEKKLRIFKIILKKNKLFVGSINLPAFKTYSYTDQQFDNGKKVN